MFDVPPPPRSPSPASETPPRPSAGKWNCASCRRDVNPREPTPFISLIDDQGNRTEIPEPFFRQLARITRLMREGRAIIMVPEEEDFTTQAAANYLGMSRQHLVNLLEDGKIPHHRVGTHRRVTFKDLLEFESKRDAERRTVLEKAFDELDEAGLYDNDSTGDPP